MYHLHRRLKRRRQSGKVQVAAHAELDRYPRWSCSWEDQTRFHSLRILLGCCSRGWMSSLLEQ